MSWAETPGNLTPSTRSPHTCIQTRFDGSKIIHPLSFFSANTDDLNHRLSGSGLPTIFQWILFRVEKDTEEYRRATVFVAALLGFFSLNVLVAITDTFTFGPFDQNTLTTGFIAGASGSALLYIRKTGLWKAPAPGFLIIVILSLVPLCLSDAGQGRGIAISLMTVPLLTALILDVRWTLVMASIVGGEYLLMSIVHYRGDSVKETIDGAVSILSLGVLTIISLTFESLRIQSIRRTQAALQAAEAAGKARMNFLSMMSHEIRTPLNGILGLSNLLMSLKQDSEQKMLTETVVGCGESLLVILNDILDISKLEAGALELENIPLELRGLVNETLKVFAVQASEKQINLTQEIMGEPLWILGDPTRIRQVLNNLLSNAIKFTSDGGVELTVTQDNATTIITVQDSGIGMTEAQQAKIFDAFVQADVSTTRTHGGSGLGLSIVQRLVEAMNGKIEVISQKDVGTTFVCSLPLPLTHPPLKDERFRTEQAAVLNLRVLLVEDNPVNQMLMVKILEKEGCVVEVANNGSQGVTMAEQGSWDIIIMDCQMPVMDGYEATRRIRGLDSEAATLPIIAMTANAMIGDRERCLEAGMTDYLTKPISKDLVIRSLKLLTQSNT